MAVEKWVARASEPQQVQTLPGGRLLLYEGAAVELGLNEQTGEEVVRAVSATGESVEGPRGLRVGMSVQEAAALFACLGMRNTYEKTMAFKLTLANSFSTVILILYCVLSLSGVSVFLYFNF